jgi:hypothetical protein
MRSDHDLGASSSEDTQNFANGSKAAFHQKFKMHHLFSRNGSDVFLQDIFNLLWQHRLIILGGALLGAAAAALFVVKTNKVFYRSSFLIDVDQESLPANRDPEFILTNLNRLLASPNGTLSILESIFTKNLNSPERKQIVEELLIGNSETYLRNPQSGKILSEVNERLFQISRSPQAGSYFLTAVIPEKGFKKELGSTVVSALNALIQDLNNFEVMAAERKNRTEVQDLQKQVEFFRGEVFDKKIYLEIEDFSIRNEIAGIEYELSKFTRGQPDINDFLASARPQNVMNLTARPSMVNNMVTSASWGESTRSEFSSRVERIILILSALQRENRIDEDKVQQIRQRIAQAGERYHVTNSQLTSMKNTYTYLLERMNAMRWLNLVDRSKYFLPTFRLNVPYYNTLITRNFFLEEPVATRNITIMTVQGFIIGAFLTCAIGLFLMFIQEFFPSKRQPSKEFAEPKSAMGETQTPSRFSGF